MSALQAEEGDVFRYDREQFHCREGWAIAKSYRGHMTLVDTFWGGMGQDSHHLTDKEIGTAEFAFRPSEYRELDRDRRETYDDFAPEDRAYIPSQHGLQVRQFVKLGAKPDFETKVRNAREAVEAAKGRVRSAEWSLQWAQQVLDSLLAASDA